MASEPASPLLAFLRRLAAPGRGDVTDGELLARFAAGRDEAAFTALLHRHGAMVLGVCRGILGDECGAEDVFQSTFLVLARKAGAIGKPASVASWLHGVACRLALRARAAAARRRACEKEAAAMPRPEPADEVLWRDLRPVLHREVDRLPRRYRAPFVLCYLEGKTNEEAAAMLGCPKGTILSRLSRARERLRTRLTRQGLVLTGGLLVTALAGEAARASVPSELAERTLRAAVRFAAGSGAGIAPSVLAGAQWMLRAALVARLQLALGALLAVAVVGGAAVAVSRTGTAAHPSEALAGAPSGHAMPAAPPAPQKREPRTERLQGTWKVVATRQRGRDVSALDDRRLVIAGERCTLSAGREEVVGIVRRPAMTGDLAAGPAGPRWIDLRDGTRHLHGVYALEGDRLIVCLSNASEVERPTTLAGEPGSNQLRLTLERE